MPEAKTYTHPTPRPGSRYKQYFFKGRNLRAETLYRATLGPEPMAAEEVAEDYNVPVEAVHESILYCLDHAELLQKERNEDWTQSRALDADDASPLTASARVGP